MPMMSMSLVCSQGFPGAIGIALKFRTTSLRYYMFIVQPRHRAAIQKAEDDMLSAPWGEHFRLL